MATKIKTLLFDMGNVLVYFSHERMCRQIGQLCGRSADEVRAQLLDSPLQWDFERGFLSEREFHARLQDLLQADFELPALQRAAGDIFDLNHSIVPVLDSLKHQHLRLVLLSNTCITHVNWIRDHWDFLDRFDQLVLSYEAGAIKPEPRIFEIAQAAAECSPHECLYLDDIPAYVDQGRSRGWNAEVFTTTDHLRIVLAGHGINVEI